jgi:hypothetical protein
MLTKQLKALQNHLVQLQSQKKVLTKEQKQLLHEINFIDDNPIIEILDYRYEETKTESFAVASGTCPNCGKKY